MWRVTVGIQCFNRRRIGPMGLQSCVHKALKTARLILWVAN